MTDKTVKNCTLKTSYMILMKWQNSSLFIDWRMKVTIQDIRENKPRVFLKKEYEFFKAMIIK